MRENTSPKVTVVMPCYNAEPFIAESIESVIRQSFHDWEMIIVDDGSKDNSLDIIKQYAAKDDRIRYIASEKPSGSPAEPRNIGIRAARGRYIAFLDSDDIWTEDKLADQIALFSNGDYVVVNCHYESITEDGKRSNRIHKEPMSVDYKKLLRYNGIGCSEAVFDTQKVGKPIFKNIGHEDYLFWLDVMKLGGVSANTGKVQLLYRERSGSTSANKLRAMGWTWKIYRKEIGLPLYKACFYFFSYLLKGIERHI